MRRKPVIQANLPKDARAAFERKIESNCRREGDCWIVLLAPATARPAINIGGVRLKAHQWAYAIYRGSIPTGLDVCHTCDVPRCVNPDHLWLGTHAQNMADCKAKGRRPAGRGSRPDMIQLGDRNNNARLSELQAREILALKDELPTKTIAARFGVSRDHIYQIWSGRRWAHLQPNPA